MHAYFYLITQFCKETCIRDKVGRYVLVIGGVEGQQMSLINVYNLPGKEADLLKKNPF